MKKNKSQSFIVSLAAVLLCAACQPAPLQLKEGRWRGEFVLPENRIPFIFEVRNINPDSTVVCLVNGKERVPLKNISRKKDSVFMAVDLYDAELAGKLTGNSITGKFRKLNTEKRDEGIGFVAEAGNSPRFAAIGEASVRSISGTWDMLMGTGETADKTVGIFEQTGASLTGSILTNTGDYRYLEGAQQGNRFQLSAFSGSSPYLVKGEFTSDSTFTGEFITPRKSTKIVGHRNPSAALADPYSFSKLKEGYSTIAFTFPNLDNVPVSLSDPKYKGKVVIVTILGSWCPNCLDEAAFLAPWYKANRERGVEIIGLAFERKNDFEFAKRTLSRLKDRFDIQYDILFAGLAGTESASKALPALNGISAFPSSIFIDRKGNVRKIHTGFSGPATGRFYQEFQAEFNALMDELLSEK